ncbi:MAG: hypothetical protein Ct9H300mP25_09390 [Acidobacteriota bacterium]|nr:MAG: hypothetical protein Ct9H300mP25_09390 [Acidobacteriota bacterium]
MATLVDLANTAKFRRPGSTRTAPPAHAGEFFESNPIPFKAAWPLDYPKKYIASHGFPPENRVQITTSQQLTTYQLVVPANTT